MTSKGLRKGREQGLGKGRAKALEKGGNNEWNKGEKICAVDKNED
jgi:hypothetical protein